MLADYRPGRPVSPGLGRREAPPLPDLSRLAELHARSLLLDRCAAGIGRTAEEARRLEVLRQRLLISMLAAGLPRSRWFRVGRFGLFLEPRPEPRPTASAYRLHTAPWAAVRFASVVSCSAPGSRRARGALSLLCAYLWPAIRTVARHSGGAGS